MPVLDFPNHPTVGDQWVGDNGALYEWDGSTWNLAAIVPGMAAGGDLTGSYPNPQIALGVVGPNELDQTVKAVLPPAPTMPADGGKVLTVTPVTGVSAWQQSSGLWRDIAAHSTIKPITAGRSLELDTQTGVWFGDSTTSCPAVRTPNQDIIVQSAVGRTAWFQSGQSGGTLGLTPTTASLSVDLLLQGGVQIASYKGGAPASGSLQFLGNQLQVRVSGVWQTIYPTSGGGGGIPEAPIDGTIYGRQNSAWAAISNATGPVGPAGGVLAGTYPNPQLAPLAVTNAAINDVGWGKLTGVPASFPPSGAASGSLTGTYPSPTIANLAVSAGMMAAGVIPTTLPPSGAAGGDLAGTYPNPTVAVAARSPLGAAGGDLLGTYPNPTLTTIAKSKWTISGTTITPVDPSKIVALAPIASPIQWGTGTYKGRLDADATIVQMTANVKGTGSDDTTKPSWSVRHNVSSDWFAVWRAPATTGISAWAPLLTLDATGLLTVPASGGNALQWGTRTAKGRLTASTSADYVELSLNRTIGNTQDNVAVPSWFLSLAAHPAVATASPGLQLTRVNEGDTSDQLIAFVIDNSGNLTIGGPSGFKTTGTAWENPSDPRIKRNAALYTTGLAAILNLDPISFFFNGKGGTVDDGQQCYGFDASAVRAVLPECVGVRRGKLDDDETDILTLDTSNFTLALINAVKELAMRVAVLEAR